MLKIEGRVTIVGDVHGQYYDFYDGIIKTCFKPEQSDCKMLFLGDYVDRGAYGPEIVLLLFALK